MNVVFDLGGVLLDWNPDKIITSVFPDTDRHRRIRTAVFEHPDWLELDRGTLDPAKAICAWAERAELTTIEATALMDHIPRSLVPILDSQDLLRRLATPDTRLFCLSNMHTASINFIEKSYSFCNRFEGMVISCRVHMNKPEPEIYQHLLKQHKLIPAETVFIDDTAANINAAMQEGILGIHFDNAKQCEDELRALGCPVAKYL